MGEERVFAEVVDTFKRHQAYTVMGMDVCLKSMLAETWRRCGLKGKNPYDPTDSDSASGDGAGSVQR